MKRDEMLRRLKDGEDPLELSIEKWEDIVENLESIEDVVDFNTDLETGNANCALCEMFDVIDCEGCPVAESGSDGCENTPYSLFRDSIEDAFGDGDSTLEDVVECARRELEFLRGLRKEE